MSTASAWVTKRKGKRGVSYNVRWVEPGTRIIRSKAFKRLEDAKDYVSELKKKIRNNRYVAPVKIDFDDWKEQHLANLRNSPRVDLSDKTITGHKEALNALGRLCKPKTPKDITPEIIDLFREKQRRRGLAARTINKHIAAIRSALSYAVRDKIIPCNELLGLNRLFLREDAKTPQPMEVGEVTALVNVATDIRYKATVLLAYYHGLRRGEICYLRWCDIDFDNLRIDIVNREEKRTKTRRSRSVALRQETVVVLRGLQDQLENEWIFGNPAKFYWSCDKWLPELCQKAEIDCYTLQNLRITCNTIMQDAGINRDMAMQILGQTTPRVNRKHYTGFLTEQQRHAIHAIPPVC